VLGQAACTLGPTVLVTQLPQDHCTAIGWAIKALAILAGHRLKGTKPMGSPGLDMPEAVSTSG
jgi:hypothetical protein